MEQENEETPPSSELISTVSALVGSVARVWLKVSPLRPSKRQYKTYEIAYGVQHVVGE